MNMMRKMLWNAAAEVREAMLDSLLKQEDMNHVFSRRFERKTNRLIQKQKGVYVPESSKGGERT